MKTTKSPSRKESPSDLVKQTSPNKYPPNIQAAQNRAKPKPLLSVFHNGKTVQNPIDFNNTHLEKKQQNAGNDQFTTYLNRKHETSKARSTDNSPEKTLTAQPSFAPSSTSPIPFFNSKQVTKPKSKSVMASPRISKKGHYTAADLISYGESSIINYRRMEKTFDQIASNCTEKPLHELVEANLRNYFQTETVLFFYDVPSVHTLYCPSFSQVCPHGSGLVGYCHFLRKILNIKNPSEHVSYSKVYDIHVEENVILFPLFDHQNKIKAIVEIYRRDDFSEEDVKFVQYFQKKIKLYSRFFFLVQIDEKQIADFAQAQRMEIFVSNSTNKLKNIFNSKTAEIWSYDSEKKEIKKYPNQIVLQSFAGIVGYSLKNMSIVSLSSANLHPSFNSRTDGQGDQSIIVIPVKDQRSSSVFAICLRGKRFPHFFTEIDEQLLLKLSPIIASSLISSEIVEENFKGIEQSSKVQERLQSLLSVAEVLSGQLHIDQLIPSIMTKACQLVNADRCSLFLLNESHDKLVSFFHGGLDKSIEVPINTGIVGYTATTAKSLNIQDAYNDPRFSKTTDMETGYKTQTLLCVPIFDEKKRICGVTEMINKKDGYFTDDDERMIQVFNIFCSISIENARLYQASIDLSVQLRSVLELSLSISQPSTTIKPLLEEILKNARKVVGAGRAMIYLQKKDKTTQLYAIDEDSDSKKKSEQERSEISSKKLFIKKMFQEQEKLDNLDEEDRQREKENLDRLNFILNALNNRECAISNDPENPYNSMIVVPIIGSDRLIIGALFMQWKKKISEEFTIDDQKLMEGFAVFVSISIEKCQKKEDLKIDPLELALREKMSESERQMTIPPKSLCLLDSEMKSIQHSNFLATYVNDIRLCFWLFKGLDLSNELIFSFSFLVRQQSTEKDWHDCLEKAQFFVNISNVGRLLNPNSTDQQLKIASQSSLTRISLAASMSNLIGSGLYSLTSFSKIESIVLLFAILSQKSECDHFTLLDKRDALTCLFSQSNDVETDYHILSLLNIIGRINLFGNNSGFFKDCLMNWSLLTEVYRATSMQLVTTILEKITELEKVQEDWYDDNPENYNNRILFLKLLMICINFSHLTKPFDIANNYLVPISDEFFDKGDIFNTLGMVFSSLSTSNEENSTNTGNKLKTRENLNREQSRVGFVQNVCLLAYQKMARIIPIFGHCADQLKQNINVWKNRTE